MITLNGLTERQKVIADMVWGCNTLEQAKTIVDSLSKEDQRTARVLMLVMVHEVLEENIDDYVEEACTVISSVRY